MPSGDVHLLVMDDQHGAAGGSASDAAPSQPAISSVPAVQPAPGPSDPVHRPAVAGSTAITAAAVGEPVPGHSDDDAACMADRSASASSVGASSEGSAAVAAPDASLAAPPGSFRIPTAVPAHAASVADETDDALPAHVDLGYLTDGVAAYIASLRDRLRQTQADLLTVPAQELRFALAV